MNVDHGGISCRSTGGNDSEILSNRPQIVVNFAIALKPDSWHFAIKGTGDEPWDSQESCLDNPYRRSEHLA